jgi:aspartate-semialdehyde dehydrogenase
VLFMKQGIQIAVVGATGAVGKQLLAILSERKFPVRKLLLFSSSRSEGKVIGWNGEKITCQVLKPGCFKDVQIVFFDASDAVSQEWVPHAVESGSWVIDNSATFRMDDQIPLLVPEVNGHLLDEKLDQARTSHLDPKQRILAGPNCSTVQLVVALKPILTHWGIKRVIVSTYQSTSGAGASAMDELSEQTRNVLDQKPASPQVFAHNIAFNCIPQIGGFKGDGYTSEEQKIMAESQKILNRPELRISATAVRVPTYLSHAESVNVECEKSFSLHEVREVLSHSPGIIVQDDPQNQIYPMGNPLGSKKVESASGRDAVYVGRIRKDPSTESGLNFWVVSDNLRKGAALNAVQIGEKLLQIFQ